MTAPEDQNGLREALARAEAEVLERADVEAELMAGIPHNPAPPPIPVRGPYFLIECEHCGWVGSSEQGGTFCGDWGDSDVYCPVCDETMRCDGPNEADTAKHGQAVFDRITAAEAEVNQVAKERDGCAELAGEAYADVASLIAERDAAVARADDLERDHTDMMWQRRRADERALAAEAEITRLKEGMEAQKRFHLESLREAHRGFVMIHDGLAESTRPKQACGELCAHWRDRFAAEIERHVVSATLSQEHPHG